MAIIKAGAADAAPQATKVPEANVVAAAASTPTIKVLLELGAHKINRYVLNDFLYERDKVYEFTESQATRMLMVVSEHGIPMFRRWKKKAPIRRVETDGKEIVSMPDTTTAVPSGPINIGDDAELLEAGIMLPEVSGAVSLEDQDGNPVGVVV